MTRLSLLTAACVLFTLTVAAGQDPDPKPGGDALPAPKQLPPPPAAPGFPGAPMPSLVPGVPLGGVAMKDVIPAMIESLKDADADVRRCGAATLAAAGREAVPALLEAFKGKDRDTRANAAYVLGQIGQPAQETVPTLLGALKDEDAEVRRRAAYAVYRIVRDTRPPTWGLNMPGGGFPGTGSTGPANPGSMRVTDPGLLGEDRGPMGGRPRGERKD